VVRVRDGLRLGNRSAHQAGDDLLLAWDVLPDEADAAAEPDPAP
jgi:hypothetical protein